MTQQPGVQIKDAAAATVAYLACQGPYAEMGNAMSRLLAWVSANGWQPAGPPAAVYFNSPAQVPPEELRWEVCCPLSPQVEPRQPDAEGRGVRRLESRTVAATIHQGPYNEVSSAYQALTAWIQVNGYEVRGPAEEVYLNDPASTAPQELLTEVRLPVSKRS